MRRALPLALAAALAAAPLRADIHALVVGVDAYAALKPLGGATNDARDLAGALRRLGADVELLTDGAATREAVLAAFARQAAKAGPGDMFVFTFAGHGMQEPEAIPGDETDGMDETILFAGFAPSGAAAGARLRDNEIGALLARVHPEARALVVVDSCHSGTMTRSGDRRGRRLVTRYAGVGGVSDDPLPKPDPATRGLDLSGADNLVFVAAAGDDEQIPEIEIGGAPRGALSWTVARALEGSGGFSGPDMPLGEFRTYVQAQVRALSAARQTPSVTFRDAALPSGSAIVPRSALGETPPPPPEPPRLAPARVLVHGGAAGFDLGAAGVWAEDIYSADLVWDAGRGDLIDAVTADLVAEARTPAALAAALSAWRAARSLSLWPERRHAEVKVSPGDGRHRIGARVGVSVSRPEAPAFLTVVNLASTGEVQFLFPAPEDRALRRDLVRPGPGLHRIGEAPVTAPVGADHVIAILSAAPEAELHRWLEEGRGVDAEAFAARLRPLAAAGARIGVTPIFTGR